MSGHLFIKTPNPQSLDTFVLSINDIVGCSAWKMRENSNYIEERYFHCHVLGLEIVAAISDDVEFHDYQFWLAVKPNLSDVSDRAFVNCVADVIARMLALKEHTVAIPNSIAKSHQGGTVYRRNYDAVAGVSPKVILESF